MDFPYKAEVLVPELTPEVPQAGDGGDVAKKRTYLLGIFVSNNTDDFPWEAAYLFL